MKRCLLEKLGNKSRRFSRLPKREYMDCEETRMENVLGILLTILAYIPIYVMYRSSPHVIPLLPAMLYSA